MFSEKLPFEDPPHDESHDEPPYVHRPTLQRRSRSAVDRASGGDIVSDSRALDRGVGFASNVGVEVQPFAADHTEASPTDRISSEHQAMLGRDTFWAVVKGGSDTLGGIYNELTGGGSHPLDYVDPAELESLLNKAWDDKDIDPFHLEWILSEVVHSHDSQLLEQVSHIALKRFNESSSYYDRARALQVMIDIVSGSDFWHDTAEDLGEIGSLTQTITEVAENSRHYMLALRAQTFLSDAELLDGAESAARESEGLFSVASGVMGYYDNDRLYAFQFDPHDVWDRDSPVEDYAHRASLFGEEFLHKKHQGNIQELLYDYEYMMRESTRTAIEKDLGIAVSDMEIDEQVWLIQFLKDTKNSDLTHYKEFFESYGSEGARTFLSLEHGGQEMGERILAIGERYREGGLAEQIFAKYSEIVDASKAVEGYMREQVGGVDGAMIDRVSTHMLVRAKEFLAILGGEENPDREKARAIMDRLVVSAEIFKSAFKVQLDEGGPAAIESLKDGMFAIVTGEGLSDARRAQLRDNYHDSISAYPEALQEALRQKYEKALYDPAVDFHIYTHEDRVVCSASFEAGDDGSAHFFGFAADATYDRSGIGSTVLQNAIDQKAEHAVIMAECDPFAPISDHYLSQQGFVGTGFFTFYDKPSMQIRLDRRRTADHSEMREQDRTPVSLGEIDTDEQPDDLLIAFTRDDFDAVQSQVFERGYVMTRIQKQPGGDYHAHFRREHDHL